MSQPGEKQKHATCRKVGDAMSHEFSPLECRGISEIATKGAVCKRNSGFALYSPFKGALEKRRLMKRLVIAVLLFVGVVGVGFGQVATVRPNYFAESGLSYDYFGRVPAETTGFGLRIGDSNTFSVTNVDTTLGKTAGSSTFATLRTGLEYHLAVSGNWEFLGLGAVGVMTDGGTTLATFAGGMGVSYDFGHLLSKGKVSVPVVFEYRITAIAATQVRPTYGVEFRKTF